MAGTYKTSGRERLLRFLSEHPDTPYTVDELAVCLSAATEGEISSSCGGKSSLYRQLAELVADGTVRRDRETRLDTRGENGRGGAAVYRYIGRSDCDRHFHLQCVCCGRLLHLDCRLTDDLLSHIQNDHHFLISLHKSVLYGICEKCGGSEENGESEGSGENGYSPKKL